ncbi:MAG TPA: hypothetical protein VH137_04840, partial [Gemmatimonadales bacterium]|nr:hypothetical protein [Gemmatimonadales bacterium]
MSGCTMDTLVERHFAGTISPHAERVLRGHLPTCSECRGFYERHLQLSRLDPAALAPEERIARGLGLRPRRRPVVALGALGLASAAAAAAMLMFLRPSPRADGFTARGNVAASAERSSRVFVYEVDRDGHPAPAADSVKSGDELAFAYENGAGKRRLAVFGVDEGGQVYWFFPAWTSEASDPVAVSIEGDARRHELPE